MRLKNYRQFESKDENKFLHVEVSSRFEEYLKFDNSNFELWGAIMAAESDISFIDFGKENDSISFLPFHKFSFQENPWHSNKRQEMKVGKFIRKMYEDSGKGIRNFENQVNKKVDEYKSYRDRLSGKFGEMEIVKGEEISKWYSEDNYADGSGTLNNSCMRYNDYKFRFKIYEDNPDKISLLILLNEEGKLIGRALLWILDDGSKYMDRVYTCKAYDAIGFEKYAEKNGINLTYSKMISSKVEPKLTVKLKNIDYISPLNYPFMDTFKCCYVDRNILTNYFLQSDRNCLYLNID